MIIPKILNTWKFQPDLLGTRQQDLSSAYSNSSCLASSKAFVNSSSFRAPASIPFSPTNVTSNEKVGFYRDPVDVL